ncbi:MAG TPA: Clp protease N-terminal domain-containing protein [Terriglobia bacterium]|nr:Clp protease N-terminal domain-containing protein [Terriglobia bacterium]
MFERYNGLARRVVFFARFAASQSGEAAIESEHLLLGLIREAGCVFSRLIPSLALEELRASIPRRVVVENPAMRIHMPLSAELRRILGYSAEEANDLDQRQIGPEHLLLALLRENTCLAARLLTDAGVQIESLRQKLALEAPCADARPLEQPSAEVGRDVVHALVDRLPEQVLGHVKEIMDRIVYRFRREDIRDDEATVIRGTFSSNRAEDPEGTSQR